MKGRRSDDQRLRVASWLPTLGPFGCFGRRWTVRTDDEALADLLADLYADLSTSGCGPAPARFAVLSPSDDGPGVVLRDGIRIDAGHAPSHLLGALVWSVNRWALDDVSRDRLLLHAGGVVREDGIAVLLPAPSESGKSTLTTGLLDRGLAYLSDEAVALDPDGTLTGYPKPLSIDRGAWSLLSHHSPDPAGPHAAYLARQWHVRASAFARVVGRARLGVVIFPRYVAAARTALRLLSPSEAVVFGGRSTFAPANAGSLQTWQVRVLAEALAGVSCFELLTSDLDAACGLVVDTLAAAPGLRAIPT
jgi:hypothetical protein